MRPSHRLDDQPFRYEGFSTPNGTIVPDDVFDVLAPRLSEAELRVLLYIVRRTFGFKKNADAISLKQLTDGITARDGRILDSGTGMSRKGVIAGIKGLLDKGVINVQKRLDDRGENQVNVYTLRFREGVVTSGNYRSNPNTLPGVTDGYPQESALQESVGQQQHADSKMREDAPGGPATTDVVVGHAPDPAFGRPDLYEALRDLGVHHHTAGKLLREYAHSEIELMLQYVSQRLQQGWTPQESVPAWLVAAIRNHYEPPPHFRSRQDREAEAQQAAEQREMAEDADQRERERVTAELSRQRQGKLLALGIEPDVDDLWQRAQQVLRERGEWSLALAMCYLKRVEDGLAIVLVPVNVRRRVEPYQQAVQTALSEVWGQAVRVVWHEMGGQ
ncbi:MAG: hypothetical protein ABFD94_11405 [Armatimonadia bacterium]